MEPTKNDYSQTENRDIDLATIIYKSIQFFKNFIRVVGKFFIAIFHTLLLGLLFAKKNMLWLLLGLAAGLGFQLYDTYTHKTQFSATTVIRLNYGSTRALYNEIENINNLRYLGRVQDVARIFGISENEAQSISLIEMSPVNTDEAIMDLYSERYLKYKRYELLRNDSSWLQNYNKKAFNDILTRYDFPVQEIKVTSSDPLLFRKLQKGLVNLVSNNEALQRTKNLMQKAIRDEEVILEQTIVQLDSLSNAYSHRIVRSQGLSEAVVPAWSIMGKRVVVESPEIELLNMRLIMKNELTALRAREAREQDIAQVDVSFATAGQLEKKYTRYLTFSIGGLLGVYAILLLIELFKFLSRTNVYQKLKEEKI